MIFIFFSSSKFSVSSSGSMLNPMITLSSSSWIAAQEYTSLFEIGPMPAFRTWMFACFNRVSNAWRLPSESAFAIIPVFEVWISSDISFSNSFVIFSRVLS